jgi:hypothetical protein
MLSRICSLVILRLDSESPYLQAEINEMVAFTSMHTMKGVCEYGVSGRAKRRVCAEAARMHHVVCMVPEAGDACRLSL